MHLWIVNQYAGDEGQQATRSFDFGRQLVAKGHQVTIFTSGFSHYQFREERLQPGENWRIEYQKGVRFVWLRVFPHRVNDWRRAANMLTFFFSALWRGIADKERPDVVIGSSPQTLAIVAAYLLAVHYKAVFFYEIRDLWPQTLIDYGTLSERSPVTKAWKALDRFLCRKAHRIIALLPNIGDYLSAQGLAKGKIVYVPNGADLLRYDGMRKYDGGNNGLFTFMYLGGVHRHKGVEVIVEAARLLQERGHAHVKFVIVGEGPSKAGMMQRAKELGLRNLEFRPLVPKTQVPSVMNEATAFIHHLIRIPVLKYGISSNKLFDYMSAGRPIIFAIESSNNPVAEAGAGISIPPEDPEAMCQAVLQLCRKTRQERIQMGENARKWVEQNHSMEILSTRLESACLAALKERESSKASILANLKS